MRALKRRQSLAFLITRRIEPAAADCRSERGRFRSAGQHGARGASPDGAPTGTGGQMSCRQSVAAAARPARAALTMMEGDQQASGRTRAEDSRACVIGSWPQPSCGRGSSKKTAGRAGDAKKGGARDAMLGGSQGAILGAGVLALDSGRQDEAIGLMTAATALPDAGLRAWAHFFLGLLLETRAQQRKHEAAARGEVLTGLRAHAHRTRWAPRLVLCPRRPLVLCSAAVSCPDRASYLAAGDQTGFSTAYEHYVKAIETAPKPDAAAGLWARTKAADIAMQFKEPAQAMRLLRPVGNTQQAAWDGITLQASEGMGDGAWHYVSRSSSSRSSCAHHPLASDYALLCADRRACLALVTSTRPQVTMLNTLMQIHLQMSDVEAAIPLALR